MFCYIATSHTNTHTVHERPTPKNEIRCFQNGLVCELKVVERKLLRQSKTLCSDRRNQFSESQDYSLRVKRFLLLVTVVQKVDSTIHRINHHPPDSTIGFPNTYTLDSDLSGE